MIVDAMSCFVPLPDVFAAAQLTLARMDGYLGHFDRRAVDGKTAEEIEREALIAGRRSCPTREEFFAKLDEAQVDKAVIYNEMFETALGIGTTTNDAVAEYVTTDPSRLVGVGGVDPLRAESVADMARSVRELGMRGFVLAPFKHGLDPMDPKLQAVYANCQALDVPLLIHGGINWWRAAPYDVGHPRHIDAIAAAFPKLTIVVLHAGWPWMLEAVMVTWRHQNVFLDISAHRPRHFTIPGSGWEPLMQFGPRAIQDKIIFGSTWTLLGTSIRSLIDEIRALPLKSGVADKWLGLNAARAFRL
ncbi:MAG: amidohydrolase [Rhizobiaceae bacterium]|nr:amidohydrolase [Rhizobiaceae bacterium]